MGKKITKLELIASHSDSPPAMIAKKTKLPITQVYHYLRKLGIRKTKVDFLPSADELRAEGLSQAKLAAKYGVSALTIAKRLRQAEAQGGTHDPRAI